MRYHDYLINRLDWALEERRLRLELTDPDGDKSSMIEFVGVVGWHLEDAVDGCIVLDLEELEAENARLKKAVAELTIDKIILKEVDEGPLRAAVIGLAGQYGRYGYRLIHGLLQQDGWQLSRSRVERFWKQEGLKVPRKQPRRGRLWDELLNGEIFYTLREAQVLIEQWRVFYNTRRPHSALGYRLPAPETPLPRPLTAAQKAA